MACGAILVVGYQAGTNNAPIRLPTTSQAETGVVPPIPASVVPPVASAGAPASPVPTTAPAQVAKATLTGNSVNTRYGTVQVSVTYVGNTITDVQALKLTDADNRSIQISNRAAPVLRSEVLGSQSAKVSAVSGATYTSEGYLTSLQSAIDKHV